jgi:hypothetical protein
LPQAQGPAAQDRFIHRRELLKTFILLLAVGKILAKFNARTGLSALLLFQKVTQNRD